MTSAALRVASPLAGPASGVCRAFVSRTGPNESGPWIVLCRRDVFGHAMGCTLIRDRSIVIAQCPLFFEGEKRTFKIFSGVKTAAGVVKPEGCGKADTG